MRYKDRTGNEPCLFCCRKVFRGALGMSGVICSGCVRDGKLGLLVGDGCNSVAALTVALANTRAEAFRALALAMENTE